MSRSPLRNSGQLLQIKWLSHFRPMFHLCRNHAVVFMAKCHFSTSVFKHFSSNNQLPGFYISGTLVENGLGINFPLSDSIKLVIINITYTCLESYALGYYRKKLIKILNSCLKKLYGFFFLKSGFRSDSLEKFWANSSVRWVLSRNSL